MRTIGFRAAARIIACAVLVLIFGAGVPELYAQAAAGVDTELPLRRVALFSSGVGYFEHEGTVRGTAALTLPFDVEAVNDALKSLTIRDAAQGASPSVRYPSEETLQKALQGLGIDLSAYPGTFEIFSAQRGAEIEVSAPNPITGRIAGVETRSVLTGTGTLGRESYLSLLTENGVRIIAFKDIASFAFKDRRLNEDFKKALDLIAANRAARTRNLEITLGGSGSDLFGPPSSNRKGREVSLSYIIPVPVWKVSYRLGLNTGLFQGWAIIDNGGDGDWNNVELSLVSGKPVSFIQELYPLYYLDRPTLPLSIEGTARARSHDSGYGRAKDEYALFDDVREMEEYPEEDEKLMMKQAVPAPRAPQAEAAGAAQNRMSVEAAASGTRVADQFAFTIKVPVTLQRGQSAMLPMVNGQVKVEKALIVSGARQGSFHPELAAELTNTTGMKLPAGPITVYDGGTYAGDALIEFFNEGEKRFISYGEDLSVTASVSGGFEQRLITSVKISGGVMTINRKIAGVKTYTVKNTAAEAKRLIIEHPITSGAVLVEPETALEKTAALYRFAQALPASGELTFKVSEDRPLSERIILGRLTGESLAAYISNQEIPANVRKAFEGAAALQQKLDAARQSLAEKQSRKTRLEAEQERIRENLVSVGSDSDLGREYMKRMTSLDNDIDAINADIDKAEQLVQSARGELDAYIAGLEL